MCCWKLINCFIPLLLSCPTPTSSGLVFQAVAHLKTKENLAGFFDAVEVGSGWGIGGVVWSGWGMDETLVNCIYSVWGMGVVQLSFVCCLFCRTWWHGQTALSQLSTWVSPSLSPATDCCDDLCSSVQWSPGVQPLPSSTSFLLAVWRRSGHYLGSDHWCLPADGSHEQGSRHQECECVWQKKWRKVWEHFVCLWNALSSCTYTPSPPLPPSRCSLMWSNWVTTPSAIGMAPTLRILAWLP